MHHTQTKLRHIRIRIKMCHTTDLASPLRYYSTLLLSTANPKHSNATPQTFNKLFFVAVLKVTDENSRIRIFYSEDPYQNVT